MTNREPWRVSTKNGLDSDSTVPTQSSLPHSNQPPPNLCEVLILVGLLC